MHTSEHTYSEIWTQPRKESHSPGRAVAVLPPCRCWCLSITHVAGLAVVLSVWQQEGEDVQRTVALVYRLVLLQTPRHHGEEMGGYDKPLP